jgi:PAS domain S-box-containing protein
MEAKIHVRNYRLRFTLLGLLLGIGLLGIFYLISLGNHDLRFSFSNIAGFHKQNGDYWLVVILPIVLAVFGWFLGKLTFELGVKYQGLKVGVMQKESQTLEFAKKLASNQIEAEFKPDDSNTLGNILVELRDSLRKNKEDDIQRKTEDEERNWTAEGLAKFGEILRNNNDNIEILSYEVISNLCNYINAVQGGFFIVNDDYEEDKFFELIAHFAYSRKKYNKKRVEYNEGLIGRAAYEQNTIYIDEVPEDYVDITSGLGEANPRILLIVPLLVNDQVHGILEISSFNYFPDHVIEFVEKVASSIATTISTVKINMRTSTLLNDSRAQAERLTQQEEEMRQNMEELQATQEEAAKQAEEFISFTNSVNHTLIRAEYDTNGILLYANTKFLKKLGYGNNSEVEGHHISMFIGDKDKVWFNEIWEGLAKGGKHFEGYMKHVTKSGRDLWTMATYTCIRKNNQDVEKILFLAIDTTEQKEQSLDFEGQIEAINKAGLKVEYAPSGRMLNCNQQFVEVMGYDVEDLKDYSVFNFMGEEEQSDFEDVWNTVLQWEPYKGQTKLKTKSGKEKWFDVTFSAAKNMYGEVSKVIMIGYDITDQKEMEIFSKKQNELLKKQEEELKASEVELQHKLEEAKRDIKQQFKEIEKVKVRNEKTLEGAHDAILTINQEGKVEFFNRAAETLWGYSRQEVLGNSVKMLFPEITKEENEYLFTLIHPEQRKMLGTRMEVPAVSKDGEMLSVIMLLAGAKVQNEYTYTAFIQNQEIELF